jgi:hypothetical protein
MKSKKAKAIEALVVLRGKSNSSENENLTGLSFAPGDDQEIRMEIGVPTPFANALKVDQTYKASIYPKGKKEGGVNFRVGYLQENDFGRSYDEKMTIKGENIFGDLTLKIRPDQEEIFFEKKDYSLHLEEVTEEEEAEQVAEGVTAPAQ